MIPARFPDPICILSVAPIDGVHGAPFTESQLWILCVFGICEMRSHAHLNQSLTQIGFLRLCRFYDDSECGPSTG